MNRPRPAPTVGGVSPLRRAHLSLWILTVVMVIAAGGISATIASAPSPLVGVSFAVSSFVFAVALILAARVVIALERSRRRGRQQPPAATAYPILSRLIRRK